MAVVHQELLRESLAATGHVETACLIRAKSGVVKAVSPGFEVMIKHIQCLVVVWFTDTYFICSLVKIR